MKREALHAHCEMTRDSVLNCRNTWGSQMLAGRSLCGLKGESSGAVVQFFQNCDGHHVLYLGGTDYWESWYYDMTTLQVVGVFTASPAS